MMGASCTHRRLKTSDFCLFFLSPPSPPTRFCAFFAAGVAGCALSSLDLYCASIFARIFFFFPSTLCLPPARRLTGLGYLLPRLPQDFAAAHEPQVHRAQTRGSGVAARPQLAASGAGYLQVRNPPKELLHGVGRTSFVLLFHPR